MNMPSSTSEPGGPERPPDPDRARTAVRTVGIVLVGILGMVFAGWTVMRYLAHRDSLVPLSGGQAVPGPAETGVASPTAPVSNPNLINVHVMVRVKGESGDELLIGAALPQRVALTLVGEAGQPYEARFDRVGVWAMQVPPGEYKILSQQPDLGKWRWELNGTNVTEAEEGYMVKFERSEELATLDLLLY